ncbi:FUSC family protein, partial [Vibrio sp. 10N.222.49.C9]
FVNVFLIWKIASKPALALQKVLGVNLLMVMTMSAMYLTPSFSLVVPITMLTVMALALAISAFYMKLYRDL